MKLMRITTGVALLATLAACGGGEFTVRDGPQAVHPSGSTLASGHQQAAAPQVQSIHHIVIVQTAKPCHDNRHCGHRTSRYGANDGSRPIID